MKPGSFVLAGTILLTAVTALSSSACSSTGEAAAPSAEVTPPAGPKPLTFAETIEPLVQEKCQRCHHEGGIAPFPLVTYDDLVAHGEMARFKVESRTMPPWGAFDDDDCKMQHGFKDDLRLTDAQVQQFSQWVQDGMPQGDMSKRPPAKTFGPEGLLDKTSSFAIAKPYAVPAGGTDDIECFPIDPGFLEDTWIGGANVVPGDPRVVHHVIVYTDPKSESPAKADPATGSYKCFGGPGVSNPSLVLAWAPGVPPTHYGDDSGIKVPKGAKLVLQVHYHPHPEVSANDSTSFELAVLPAKPSNVTNIFLLGNAESTTGALHLIPPSGDTFLIPANAAAHQEAMELTVPETVKAGSQTITIPTVSVLAVGSHMHWAGVDMKTEIIRKNPTVGQPANECLLGTPKYDFNWQRGYAYDEPMEKLPTVGPGDTLRFTCTYNNSTSNPYVTKALVEENRSEPVPIKLGETTLDEMCLGVLVSVRPASIIDSALGL